ncbi:hypothetical protein [Paraferrimonas sp. SM1919]|uniref:hypothetical protein n=1 Tax=Paraferrimonas sp. SM1919 TaxID=2662263 RepID=UPI0013D55FF5|nr:hypothetical protein [Paraferrimonas sp. SM1919]
MIKYKIIFLTLTLFSSTAFANTWEESVLEAIHSADKHGCDVYSETDIGKPNDVCSGLFSKIHTAFYSDWNYLTPDQELDRAKLLIKLVESRDEGVLQHPILKLKLHTLLGLKKYYSWITADYIAKYLTKDTHKVILREALYALRFNPYREKIPFLMELISDENAGLYKESIDTLLHQFSGRDKLTVFNCLKNIDYKNDNIKNYLSSIESSSGFYQLSASKGIDSEFCYNLINSHVWEFKRHRNDHSDRRPIE